VQARTGWRPTVQMQAVGSWNDIRTPRAAGGGGFFGVPTIQKFNAGSLSMTITQPVWTGGRTAAAVSAAQADVLQGRENLRRLESQVLAAAIQGYEDVRRDEQALQIRDEDVKVLQQQLDQARAKFDVGEVTRTDVAQAEAQLAAILAARDSAKAQLAISRANYAVIVGQNPGELAPEPSLAYLLPGNVDDAFAIAEKYNPQLRAQEFAEQSSRARIAVARAQRLPRVDLQASGAFLNGPLDPLQSDRFARNFSAQAVVTVPLFTGGLTTSRIRQAIEQNNADRITIETQRRSVLQQVTQSWNQLVAARSNITSNTEAVRAAEIAAEGTKQELDVGLRTTIDVLNADIVLRNAQLSLLGSRHDEYVAAANLLLAMGRLEAKDLIPTAPQYDPTKNLRKVHFAIGWVPWEEPIGVVDRVLTVPPIPETKEMPQEKAIPPGLQPPPSPQVLAPPKK
jgi:outer membrane protein